MTLVALLNLAKFNGNQTHTFFLLFVSPDMFIWNCCTRWVFSFSAFVYMGWLVLDRENIRYKCRREYFFLLFWIIDNRNDNTWNVRMRSCIRDWKRRNTVKTWRAYNNTNLFCCYSKFTRNDTAPTVFNTLPMPNLFDGFAIFCNFTYVVCYWLDLMAIFPWNLIFRKIRCKFKLHNNEKWLHCSDGYCLQWSCMRKRIEVFLCVTSVGVDRWQRSHFTFTNGPCSTRNEKCVVNIQTHKSNEICAKRSEQIFFDELMFLR